MLFSFIKKKAIALSRRDDKRRVCASAIAAEGQELLAAQRQRAKEEAKVRGQRTKDKGHKAGNRKVTSYFLAVSGIETTIVELDDVSPSSTTHHHQCK